MTASTSFLEGRLDVGVLPIVMGNVLAVFLLVTVGVIRHNGVLYLSTDPVGWAFTVVPFLIGWLSTAPLLGAYPPGAAESAKLAVPLGVRSWFAATIVGMATRWTPLFGGGVELTFVAVMLVLGSVALGVWRTLYLKLV